MNSQERVDWASQLRRGVLEFCALTLVSHEPRYGYELTEVLSQWPQLAAADGTLYPLLRRLQKDGLVDTSWQESQSGPPRKYYRLTASGTRVLRERKTEWEALVGAVQQLQEKR